MTPTYARFVAAGRWRPVEILSIVTMFLVPAIYPGQSLLVNDMAIAAIFALSLDLIVGYTGLVSLGHAAFFGVGAYSAGLFAKYVIPDPLLGLLFAIAITSLAGLLLSITILRGSTLTTVMVTLAASLLLLEVANKTASITGGADGLQGVSIAPILGTFDFDLYGRTSAYYSLTVGVVLFIIVRRFVRSPMVSSLIAIRDNRLRAAAIGVPVRLRVVSCYTIAAAIAGVAGALLAQTNSFVSLDVFDVTRSADVLLMLIIGGLGWLYGGIIGAIIFTGLQNFFSQLSPEYWLFWIGLLLVLLMMVGRERITKAWKRIRRMM